MKFLLEWGDGSRTNRRASTKQRQTISGSWARGQCSSVGGLYVYSFWGAPDQLDRFLQAYLVEKARLEARKKGHTVTEEQLQDGSIKLNISEGF
jgi:hypothetical protein